MAKIYQFPFKRAEEMTEQEIWDEINKYWYLEHAEEAWQKMQKEYRAEEELCRLIREGKAKVVIDNEKRHIGHIEWIGGGRDA